ncbi:MAG: DUF4230 domain-containing protein [Lachnospiraceae bacterium]|nr:DUF4230 domain-containing protein [Lachnospiraceae bacterium]
MRGIRKKIGTVIGVLLLLVVTFGVGVFWSSTREGLVSDQETVTQDLLEQQLQTIGELGTAQYYYTNMGRYENTLQLGGKNIPFTQKMFIISYDGTIKAGVAVKDIKVSLDGTQIKVSIPAATLLSHEVDMDSVTVFDEKNSIFNGLSTADVTNFLDEQKTQMETRAVNNGILTEAQKHAGDSLRTLYQALLKEHAADETGYTLEVQLEEQK